MQEIMEFHNKDHRVLLGYEINYREIDKETYKSKNLTKFAGIIVNKTRFGILYEILTRKSLFIF